MSLINDALRRANQAKKNPAPTPPSKGETMHPVEPSSTSHSFLIPVTLILLLILMLSLAGWFFWRGMKETVVAGKENSSTTSQPASRPDEIREEPSRTSQAPSQIAGEPSQAAVIQPEGSVPANPVVVPVTESPESGAVTVESTVESPVLKLQGIFYRPSNPTTLINGKTLAVGESVSGARVVKISRLEVILERDGQRIVLALE